MTSRFGIFGRALALTLTAGVAVSLAGCGNEHTGHGSASKDNVVQVDPGDAPLGRAEIISASYKAAMKAGSAHMSMTMSGQAKTSAQGDVSYAGGQSAMKMTMSMPQMGAGKIAMRYVDQMIYLQMPGITPPGKFVAIDPKDQNSPFTKSFAGYTDQLDPMSSVKSMESAVTSADRVAQGSLHGVSVDHYRVVVDTAKMLKKLGKQAQQAGMPKALTYDMWLDDQFLIRKMSFDFGATSVQMLLSKWGEPITVQRPAAGDIVTTPGAHKG
jgi:lipoprotein LprG